MKKKEYSIDDVIKKYPCIISHLIAESLGYFSVRNAGFCLLAAIENREDWSEYILTCFGGRAIDCLRKSIEMRHCHKGYMASFKRAKITVDNYLKNKSEPCFGLASWM